MLTKPPRKFLILLSLLVLATLVAVPSAQGGTTGKIAGKITDSQTGEPLFGINVLIVGTKFGATTDFEGNYFIINLPPGTYDL